MPNTSIRYDRVKIGSLSETPEGFLKGEAVVTRTGIFHYRDGAGGTRRELRHPDEVFKSDSLDSLKMIPMTLDHPNGLVTAENAKELSVGHVGENVRPDGRFVVVPLVVTDREAIKAVKGGVRELSLGYEQMLVMDGGTWDGERYDARQTEIRYNHLAIVDRARAGEAARLNLDSADAVEIEKEEASMPDLRKVTIDGVQYDAEAPVIQALNKATKDAEEAQTKLKEAQGLADREKGRADEAEEKAQKAQTTLDGDKFHQAVQERVGLEKVAGTVLTEDQLKDLPKSNTDLMKAIITARADNVEEMGKVLKDASPEYVAGRFDSVLTDIAQEDGGAMSRQRKAVTTKQDGKSGDPVKDARAKMVRRTYDRSRGLKPKEDK